MKIMGTVTELSSGRTQGQLPFMHGDALGDWIAEPVDAFAAWRRTMKAANGYAYDVRSIRQHVAMWSRLVAFCDERNVSIINVSSEQLQAFFEQLRGRRVKAGQASVLHREGETSDASSSTRRRYAQLLLQAFDHLVKARIRRSNPMAPLMALLSKPEAPGFVSYLSKAEEAAFLAHVQAIDESDWHRQRDKAFLLLFSASGVTEGELVELRHQDVLLDDYDPALQVSQRGLKHAHTTTITEFALPVLRRWLVTLGRATFDSPLFPNAPGSLQAMTAREVYLITRAALEASGFTGKQRGPQTLRNTFIRRQLWFRRDAATINAWTGLASDRTIHKIRRTLPNLAGTRPA
jgi:integrase/recombinase XerD